MSTSPHLFDDGFDLVFDRLFEHAVAVATRVLGAGPDAEDVASEAMARLLVRWPQLHDAPHRDAWLTRVAANQAIDVIRRRGRTVPERALATGTATDPADEVVLRSALAEALTALPRRQCEVVVLRHLVGVSEQDVASTLDMSVNSVKKHTQRAMRRLRNAGAGLVEVDLA